MKFFSHGIPHELETLERRAEEERQRLLSASRGVVLGLARGLRANPALGLALVFSLGILSRQLAAMREEREAQSRLPDHTAA